MILRISPWLQLVPFPLEYALYQISVSPVNHSRTSRNPELEAVSQYQQIYLETVLGHLPAKLLSYGSQNG